MCFLVKENENHKAFLHIANYKKSRRKGIAFAILKKAYVWLKHEKISVVQDGSH